MIHCELEKESWMQGSQAFGKLWKKAINLNIELKIFRKTCHFTKSLTPVLVLQKFQFYYRLARQNLLPGFYSILYLLWANHLRNRHFIVLLKSYINIFSLVFYLFWKEEGITATPEAVANVNAAGCCWLLATASAWLILLLLWTTADDYE